MVNGFTIVKLQNAPFTNMDKKRRPLFSSSSRLDDFVINVGHKFYGNTLRHRGTAPFKHCSFMKLLCLLTNLLNLLNLWNWCNGMS